MRNIERGFVFVSLFGLVLPAWIPVLRLCKSLGEEIIISLCVRVNHELFAGGIISRLHTEWCGVWRGTNSALCWLCLQSPLRVCLFFWLQNIIICCSLCADKVGLGMIAFDCSCMSGKSDTEAEYWRAQWYSHLLLLSLMNCWSLTTLSCNGRSLSFLFACPEPTLRIDTGADSGFSLWISIGPNKTDQNHFFSWLNSSVSCPPQPASRPTVFGSRSCCQI